MIRALVIVCALGSIAQAKPDDDVLARVNTYRKIAGLAPVKLDAKLSQGCMEHAKYMLLNDGTPAMEGLAAHKQDPSRPGATPAGAACGKAADLFPGVSDLETAVDAWMGGLYHRRPILNPTLERIGVGYAKKPNGSLMAALMFVDGKAPPERWPVAYPAKDQTGVPLEFGNEIPNPIPGGRSGGYAVTLQFPPFDKVTAVTATLVDAANKPVPFHLSTPERPATSFGQYGVVCLIPKQALRAATTYKVSITATWKTVTQTRAWSFTTVALRELDPLDDGALAKALGKPSRVRAKVDYGGQMSTDTMFLSIGRREGGRYKMVSVLIPAKLWATMKLGKANALDGKMIEIEATPQLVGGGYLNLPISNAQQLRIVKP
ncbi:MAG TPA: CAP domain-containing protein [Kofleriaceae bacterium]